jgi:hypothetical protein
MFKKVAKSKFHIDQLYLALVVIYLSTGLSIIFNESVTHGSLRMLVLVMAMGVASGLIGFKKGVIVRSCWPDILNVDTGDVVQITSKAGLVETLVMTDAGWVSRGESK